MRVQMVDPSAYTPPYDRSLCAALARGGAEVELVTSRFAYAAAPPADGFQVTELFYRRGPGAPGSPLRRAAKLVQHPLDMRRLAAGRGLAMPDPDVRHFQWLTLQQYDARRLARLPRPVVLTAHDVLPREPGPGQLRGQRRLYDAVDAVVVHSKHGRDRLVGELAVPPERVRMIPHGAFDYLTHLPDERPLDPELAGWVGDRPLALFFGLLRPYKGLDVLLEAWRAVPDPEARLLVAGLPRMPLAPLRAAADERVRFLPRFVGDPEVPALFRRAQAVVLPYREIDQSGVLFTALAFGRATVLSDAGGFREVAEGHGAARLVPVGDAGALSEAIATVLADPAERRRLEQAASAAAAGPYSWDTAAADTLSLYQDLS